ARWSLPRERALSCTMARFAVYTLMPGESFPGTEPRLRHISPSSPFSRNGTQEAIAMSTNPAPFNGIAGATGPLGSLEERLERGEVIYYPHCPFSLPDGSDRQFLLEQQLGGRVHKNIGYDPTMHKVSGYLRTSSLQEERLQKLFANFSQMATQWLAGALPRYARSWRLDRGSFRPEEESTRKLRLTARNDLLHVDAFPSRPTNGCRILRLFANVNPTEPRVWVTSDAFPRLFERFGKKAGLPGTGSGWMGDMVQGLVRLFRPGKSR